MMDDLARHVERLPKIHLHCHLEGALRAETFLELTERYGISTRYRPGEEVAGPRDPQHVYHFADFREFLLTFAAVSRALAQPADYVRLAREFARDAVAQNVVYGELFVSPSVWAFFHPGLDVPETVRAIAATLHEECGDTFRLILDVTRNFGAESAMRTAQIAANLTGCGVVGIGLGGDETRFPAELFEDVFAFARSRGLHGVAHAGEAAGAESVRAAIDVLKAERIGHGVRALEDPELMHALAQRKIALEVCPTSNFLTGAARREEAHPLHALDAAGIPVTIDADDPTLFETSITKEYLYVARHAGTAALERFIRNAVDASFLDRPAKQALRERVSAELRAANANEKADVGA